jgi:putative (di)nucleoside polyphosphate hydrolase
VIDEEGFRSNVGIILANEHNQLFWAQRIGQNAWQFPQGGIKKEESLDAALYRELYEEIGLREDQVSWLGETDHWLRYRLPRRLVRSEVNPVCVGQKQKWVALRFIGNESDIQFNTSSSPEFEAWAWVSYWYPLREVVSFKREVYRQALKELAPIIFNKSYPMDNALDPFYS